jgi:GGDEF domain-containing protein
VAADDVLRFTAMLFNEVLDEVGNDTDFVGHPGGGNFVVITSEASAGDVEKGLRERFSTEVLSHYNFMDRDQGYIVATNNSGEERQAPLMQLSIGVVSPSQHDFADIREITELAAEARRKDAVSA